MYSEPSCAAKVKRIAAKGCASDEPPKPLRWQYAESFSSLGPTPDARTSFPNEFPGRNLMLSCVGRFVATHSVRSTHPILIRKLVFVLLDRVLDLEIANARAQEPL